MKKMSNEEIAEICETEGLSYTVLEYMSADSVENPILAELWQEANEKIKAIGDILGIEE